MTTDPKVSQGTIVVAVDFNDQTPALLDTAVSLARRFDVDLRFVHAVLSSAEIEALDYSASLYMYPMVAPSCDELVKDATDRLNEVLKKLPSDVRHSAVIVTGHVVPTIIAEAISKRASMILTACDPAGYNTLTEGLSTTIGLMHDAPLPVLVVSQGCPVDFTKEPFRILIADDLQPSTMEATRKGYELATRLGAGASVRHVHVHGDFREMLKDSCRVTWTEAKALIPKGHHKETSLETALEHEFSSRATALTHQGQPWRSLAEAAGVAVTLDVRTGKVARELHAAIADGRPDVLVFGRHRLLKARPFLIGRMPLRAMLEEQFAVLLVPPANELYERLPFPAAKTQASRSHQT